MANHAAATPGSGEVAIDARGRIPIWPLGGLGRGLGLERAARPGAGTGREAARGIPIQTKSKQLAGANPATSKLNELNYGDV